MKADLDGDGCLNKEEIEIACKNEPDLKKLINSSVTQVKDVDKIITDDLEEQFNTFVPISANLVTYKEGIHLPLMESLLKMTRQNKERQRYLQQLKRVITNNSKKKNL